MHDRRCARRPSLPRIRILILSLRLACFLLSFFSDEALTLGEQAKNQGLVEAFGTYVDIKVADVLKGKEKYGTALHTVKASDPVRVAMQAMNELQIGEWKQRNAAGQRRDERKDEIGRERQALTVVSLLFLPPQAPCL